MVNLFKTIDFITWEKKCSFILDINESCENCPLGSVNCGKVSDLIDELKRTKMELCYGAIHEIEESDFVL